AMRAQRPRNANAPLGLLLAFFSASARLLSDCGTKVIPPASIGRSEIVVYLCALQRSGKVCVAHLRLRIEFVDFPAPFAVAIASLFDAAEGQVRFGADRRGIHVCDSIVELV